MIAALGLVAALLSSSPEDDAPAGREDVICFAVAVHLERAGGESNQEAFRALAMYYFGRAEARMSEELLLSELRTVLPRIAGDHWEPEKRRCGEGLLHAGQLLARATEAVGPTVSEPTQAE